MRKKSVFLVVALLAFTLAGCGKGTQEVKSNQIEQVWNENELFTGIPMMEGKNAKYSEIRDVGAECWAVDVSDTTMEEYQTYLKTIEEEGFEKLVDNGKEGMEGYVYSATYKKGARVLSINYITKVGLTTISIGENLEVSEHLFYKEQYVAENKANAKTTLTMLPIYESGNCFVLQLKNGHFIIQDGGLKEDYTFLMDYLDSLVPEGEKPVIEAWFISHDHHDHIGCLTAVIDDMKLAQRVYVEGFYYSKPNAQVLNISTQSLIAGQIDTVFKLFKDTEGKRTKIYRPQIGQRYYFSDIVVDIMYTQEQLPFEQEYETFHDDRVVGMGVNYNDMSTWLRFTIDGQKLIFPGDSGIIVSINAVVSYYDKEYFNVDFFQAPHHGSNTSTVVSDSFNCKTLLYSYFNTVGAMRKQDILEGTKQLQMKAQEVMCYGDGAKVFTFPYEVGTYENLAEFASHIKDSVKKDSNYMIGIDDVLQ